ncbi:methylated-DNA--[protein]-cysteine S-methyltransferase [Sporolactobacillus terrae]|uniref:Methylated-DNA--protein-cysteine methyltransferase n=1 Tax=Sporolactobacillus terrae TaxID=269673 RepID=A0A5K7X4H8_9BACL|nr:methylated-DNA--[protein]-cysteine S-methyltransferase [Sporolactobacillus terrae]BBN99563.1 methylated-DNA--protein-cysteine methyltransferase [Sporolactobacillus terrae]
MEQKDYLAVSEQETPIGVLTLSVYQGRLCRIDFGPLAAKRADIVRWAAKHDLPTVLRDEAAACTDAADQLTAFLSGKRKTFSLKLLMKGTEFQCKVWQALIDIPYGTTRSYKEIARIVNRPKAVRAVGMANNRNPLPIVVPCHRVIGTNGALTGYAGGLGIKEYLLGLETKHGLESAANDSV